MTKKTVVALARGFLGNGHSATSTHSTPGLTIEKVPVGLGVALGGAILFLFPFPRGGGRLASDLWEGERRGVGGGPTPLLLFEVTQVTLLCSGRLASAYYSL